MDSQKKAFHYPLKIRCVIQVNPNTLKPPCYSAWRHVPYAQKHKNRNIEIYTHYCGYSKFDEASGAPVGLRIHFGATLLKDHSLFLPRMSLRESRNSLK
jgi:hypothetical protein